MIMIKINGKIYNFLKYACCNIPFLQIKTLNMQHQTDLNGNHTVSTKEITKFSSDVYSVLKIMSMSV